MMIKPPLPKKKKKKIVELKAETIYWLLIAKYFST